MDKTTLDQAIDRMLVRIGATLDSADSGFPHYANPDTGEWTRSPGGDWTGGFWVGLLWLAALRTNESRYLEAAKSWAERLRPRVASRSVFKGFLFWYGVELGNKLFGDQAALSLSRAGTEGLIQMYNPAARLIPLGTEAEEASDVGANEANIDALPGTVALLLKHADALNSKEIARNHLRQHIALCVRDDGSVCQSASFSPDDGSLVRRYTHKGIHENSTWGRAQAWAMVALAQAISAGETEFQDVALRVADWWVSNLPADHVAFWDFDDPSIPNTNRDTSATAIAAAALLKLAALVPDRATRYHAVAEASIQELVTRYLTPISADDTRPPGILTQGCFNKKLEVAPEHELIWGDYFLFESLLALSGNIESKSI